jgi:hypothetical protein
MLNTKLTVYYGQICEFMQVEPIRNVLPEAISIISDQPSDSE